MWTRFHGELYRSCSPASSRKHPWWVLLASPEVARSVEDIMRVSLTFEDACFRVFHFPSPGIINIPSSSWQLEVRRGHGSERWADWGSDAGPNEHSCKLLHLHFALQSGFSCSWKERGCHRLEGDCETTLLTPCVNALLGKFLLSSLFSKNYCYRVFEVFFIIGMAPLIFIE